MPEVFFAAMRQQFRPRPAPHGGGAGRLARPVGSRALLGAERGPGQGRGSGTRGSPSGHAIGIDSHPEHRPSTAPLSHSHSPRLG